MTAGGTGQQPLAVFDFGKTNAKMFVFAPDLRILGHERCTPVWLDASLGSAPCRVLDTELLWRWINEALSRALQQWPLGGVMVSTHGCTAALVGADGITMPILDYESQPPAAIDAGFAEVAPNFDESQTPHLPAGLNLGRQLYWIETVAPEALQRADAILCLPQYWSWRLGGRAVSELSSLGCHSHLWSPLRHDFSSLVDARGWRGRFPPFERAGAVLGHRHMTAGPGEPGVDLAVHNGVHDSNASLYLYRSLGHRDCTVVSTGTWVIVFNPQCRFDALNAQRDMLANVTVDGDPVATARFMGGREYDLITQGARCPVDAVAVTEAIRRGQMALPSYAAGGPYPGATGRLIGPVPTCDLERAAIGTLYLACMTDTVLELIRSDNPVIVDGGLANNAAFLGLLAQLRAAQSLLCNPMAEGSAAGAAALAYEALGHRPALKPCETVVAWSVPGLAGYRDRWRALAEAGGA